VKKNWLLGTTVPFKSDLCAFWIPRISMEFWECKKLVWFFPFGFRIFCYQVRFGWIFLEMDSWISMHRNSIFKYLSWVIFKQFGNQEFFAVFLETLIPKNSTVPIIWILKQLNFHLLSNQIFNLIYEEIKLIDSCGNWETVEIDFMIH
jgi:hypothetical protein